MKTATTLTAAFAGALLLAACGGSAEKQGEKMDSAIEETFTGEENKDDGLLENSKHPARDAVSCDPLCGCRPGF